MYIFHYRRLNENREAEVQEKNISQEDMLTVVQEFLNQDFWNVLRIFNDKGLVFCVTWRKHRLNYLLGGKWDNEKVGQEVNSLFLNAIKSRNMIFKKVRGLER